MLSEIFNIEKILGACDRFLYFLKINFFFLVSNIPVLLFFLFVGISQVRACFPLFLVCAVWAGPALCGVFFAMNRVLHKTDTTAWKDYKAGYLDSWGRNPAASPGLDILDKYRVFLCADAHPACGGPFRDPFYRGSDPDAGSLSAGFQI